MAKGPSERTRITPRTAGTKKSILGDVATEFGKFFGSVATGLRKEEIAAEDARNEVAIAAIGTEIRSRPEEAVEASRTGDYSAFVGSDLAKRTVVQQGGAKQIGEFLATSDKQNLQEALDSLPPGVDSREAIAKFTEAQTKGMNPFTAAAFSERLAKFSEPMIENRRKGIENAQIKLAKQQVVPLVASGLATGSLTATNYAQTVNRWATTMPGPAAKNMVDGQAIFDAEVIRISATGSGAQAQAAQNILFRNIAHRLPAAEIQEIRAKAITAAKQARNADFSRVLTDGTDRLTKWELDGGDDPDELTAIYISTTSSALKFGPRDNSQFKAFKEKFVTIIKKDAEALKSLAAFRSTGKWPGMTPKVRDRTIELAYKRDPAQGISLEASMGSSRANIAKRSAGIMSGNFEEDLPTLLLIQSKSPRGMEGNHLEKGVPTFMFYALADAHRSGGIEAAKALHEPLAEGIRAAGGDTKNHFKQRFREGNAFSTRKTEGQAGEGEFLKDWLRALSDDEKAAMGLEADDLKDVTDAVMSQLKRNLNIASLISSTSTNDGIENIRRILTQSMKGLYEFDVDVNKNPRSTIRRTPTEVQDPFGAVTTGKAFDEEAVNRWDDWTSGDATIGDVRVKEIDDELGLSLEADDLTARNGTKAIIGKDGPLRYATDGRPVTITREHAALVAGLAEVLETHGDGTVKVRFNKPVADVEEEDPFLDAPLSGNHGAHYDPKTGQWSLRYTDRPELTEESMMAEVGRDLVTGGTKVLNALGIDTSGTDEAIAKTVAGLDNEKRIRGQALEAENNPQFWSDEKLNRLRSFREVGRRSEILDEIKRREEGGVQKVLEPSQALNAGTAPAVFTDDFAPDQGSFTELGKIMGQHFKAGVDTGFYSPTATARVQSDRALTIEEQLKLAEDFTLMDNGFLEDLSKPAGQQFMQEFTHFIEGREGFEAGAYSDATGRPWKKGDKGIPTVAFGYNLERTNAKAELKEVGLDLTKVLSGEQTVTRDQGIALVQKVTAQLSVYLRKQFPTTFMEGHKWQALMSMAYNSRWGKSRHHKTGDDRGPTLIGPKLTRAIEEGRWEDAAQEIEFNSAGGVLASQKKGIELRRALEAAKFRGALNSNREEVG